MVAGMLRPGLSLVLFLALPAPAYADEPQTTASIPPEEKTKALKEARFVSFVFDGDQARAAGKLGDAARAYASALEVHDDPVVAGRLGVLLVKLKRPEEAADLLIEGIERGVAAVEPAEYQTFSDAYRSARAQVTWVTVTISQAGAKVTLDGEPKNEQGYSAFNIFVLPGEHELRASLEGYEDASVTFNALKGKEDKVTLTLKPFGKLLAKRETLRVMHVNNKLPSLDDPPEDEPEKRVVYGGVDGGPKPEKTRVEVAAGPVVVFGVASWQPAIGAVAGVRWSPKEYFSLGLEGRAAWLTSGVAGRPINAMTAGGIASACGHWRWLFGCAIGHLGLINVQAESVSYKEKVITFVKPGFGGRLGAAFSVARGFVVRTSLDAIGLSGRTKILEGQTTIVDHPPVMIGVHVLGGWEF